MSIGVPPAAKAEGATVKNAAIEKIARSALNVRPRRMMVVLLFSPSFV
jgi:hypothetical protein